LKHRVETHTARAQGSPAPVPWRWRSRGARIRGLIDLRAQVNLRNLLRSDTPPSAAAAPRRSKRDRITIRNDELDAGRPLRLRFSAGPGVSQALDHGRPTQRPRTRDRLRVIDRPKTAATPVTGRTMAANVSRPRWVIDRPKTAASTTSPRPRPGRCFSSGTWEANRYRGITFSPKCGPRPSTPSRAGLRFGSGRGGRRPGSRLLPAGRRGRAGGRRLGHHRRPGPVRPQEA
jgi:hypothetical protein